MPHSTRTSKAQARSLRTRTSETEKRLWAALRRHYLGVKIRRQVPVGKYIVDFYCPRCKLVIELDGDSHFLTQSAQRHDAKRQQELEALGLKVMRFQNRDVLINLHGVLEMIYELVSKHSVETVKEATAKRADPLPSLPLKRGRRQRLQTQNVNERR